MDCLFCKIISGDIPSTKVYEDDMCFAFKDINPNAPVHVFVIPKKHVADSIDCANSENAEVLTKVLLAIPKVAALCDLTNGYRVITNCGDDACQSVKLLHFHIMGGTAMSDRMG